MRIYKYLIIFALLGLGACGTGNSTNRKAKPVAESADERNRIAISLINRIRQLPGVVIRSGVPVFTRNASEVRQLGSIEPLYILDDYIVGNSFRSLNELVQSVDVKTIEAINGPETSFYGVRGANGVIKITTYK